MVFITPEDEHGHIPLTVWPNLYARYRLVLKEAVLLVRGVVSRREGTLNVVVTHAEPIAYNRSLPSAGHVDGSPGLPKSKDWG